MKYLNTMFNEINEDIFGGALDKPTIICSSVFENDLGNFWYEKKHGAFIFINPIWCSDYFLTFTTMGHEMCHYCDYIFYRSDWERLTHKGAFAKIASEIETFYQLPKGSI